VKAVVVAVDRADEQGRPLPAQVVLLLVRGDHELNEVKAGKLAVLKGGFRFATEAEILDAFGCRPGYLGPIGTRQPVVVVADRTVAAMSDFVCGANQADFHYTGVNWGRDLPEPVVADLRNVVEGDPSPDGRGVLRMQRGIEVGHVFYLGTKYSQALNASFLDETGKPRIMEMGCYGIGVTRLLGAAIEQNHDDKGIIWPDAIAPFSVVVCPVGWTKSEQVRQVAEQIYETLRAAGVDVVLDDRDERPGVMFADWELIGAPHRLTIGERALKDGQVEYVHRRSLETVKLPVAEAAAFVQGRLATV
jgi:prolyl-tRNA synthetase